MPGQDFCLTPVVVELTWGWPAPMHLICWWTDGGEAVRILHLCGPLEEAERESGFSSQCYFQRQWCLKPIIDCDYLKLELGSDNIPSLMNEWKHGYSTVCCPDRMMTCPSPPVFWTGRQRDSLWSPIRTIVSAVFMTANSTSFIIDHRKHRTKK